MGMDLGSLEDSVSGNFKVFLIAIIGVVLFIGIIAVSVFFFVVSGEEQVMVPDVVNKELTQALLELQVKELYPRIQLRYTQTSQDKGLVLEQEPKPGTIVKAGRRVRLVISQGVVLNRVENYAGKNIDEVRQDFHALASSGSGRLLTVREPLMYEFSSEPSGTILSQKPEPLTEITGPTEMVFVVSRGREDATITVPQLTGMDMSRALQIISSSGINFHFTSRQKNNDENGGIVFAQNPAPGSTIPRNSLVDIIVNEPGDLGGNEIFKIFKYNIPENPYPLAVKLEAQLPASDERTLLINVNYQGGEFTVPYKLPRDTVLILSMMNRELYRETVN